MNVQTMLPKSDRISMRSNYDTSNQLNHVMENGDEDLGDVTSRQEWTDFLSSSVLALSLDDPKEDELSFQRMKPQPISTSPAQVTLRAGSPLVLAMSPLALIPSGVTEDSAASWATWQLSIPENNQEEHHDNDGRHSPLGVPLIGNDQTIPNRMRAKSFSTFYSHEASSIQVPRSPPLPGHLPSSNNHYGPPENSNFSLRRYSGDFETFGSQQDMHPPPPRGIRSYSMGGYPSPTINPTDPRHLRSPSLVKSPVPRQLPRQPPLPMKMPSYEWSGRPMPPTNGTREDAYPSVPGPPPPLPPQSTSAATPVWELIQYEVQFKRCRKDTFVGSKGFNIGEYVKVEGDRGEDVGHVTRIVTCEIKQNDEDKETGQVKRIMRLASDSECELLRQQHKEEQEVLQVCRTKVRQRMLPMNVIDAEYQFDRNKLTFFFEADRRIDFRELVRDLFAIYKTRIWLQQVVNKNNQYISTASGSNQMHQES